MPTTDVVRVRNLTYEYPGVRALDDVTFSVPRGSVTALVGPNGAGKTTLLRCMAALDQPLEGEIEVDGIDVLEHPRECHRRIGYLSDFFGLYGSLTVRQCLAYAASSQGLADRDLDAAVKTTATRLNLTAKLEVPSDNLSRGQRQRVAIGQALIHAPGLLILDEPASGLDPEARHELAGLFQQLRESGMTLIVSSHILAELDEYSTHMLVLRAGQVVEHRALNQAPVDGRRVRVALANPPPLWRDTLHALRGLTVLELEPAGALLAVPGDASEHARVLRELVSAGLPVASFAEEAENLHASYLRTVQAPTEQPKGSAS